MQRYAEAYSSWVEPTGQGPRFDFSRWLIALDTSTVYPLMFLLLVEAEDKVSQAEIDGIVEDLESYLVRRAVCGLTNKQYNRFFVGLLRKLRKSSQISRAAFREYLTAGKGDSVRWPDDEEFGRAFVHRPAYRILKREVAGMLLHALERTLVTSKHEQLEVVGKLSIEHVMPQEWEAAWPLGDDSDEGRERRDRLLHAFGNLTLVTPSFNTALSNKSFVRKQKELKRIARLLLSAYFEDLANWDELGIVSRGKYLFDRARRRWPHPSSPEKLDDHSLDFPPEASWKTLRGEEPAISAPPIDLAAARALLDRFCAARDALLLITQ
jgi:hypothetical protein